MTDTLHRSIYHGTNLSCDSGNRLPDGVVSAVSRGPPFLVALLLSFFYSTLRPVRIDSPFLSSTVAHHRRSGQVFTQDQEEMILIGAFGLFWFGRSRSPCSLSLSFVPCHTFRMSPEEGTCQWHSVPFRREASGGLSSCLPGSADWDRGRPAGQEKCQCQCQSVNDSSSLTLFLAFLVAWRAVRQRWSFEGEMGLGGGAPSAPRRQPGFTGNTRGRGGYKAQAWPCSPYDVDCVVEEWSYY